MELLVTLGVLGGLFVFCLILLGFIEVLIYLVAGIKAFPIKVHNIYNNMIKNNEDLIKAKNDKKAKKLEAKLKEQNEEVLNNLSEEIKITEDNVENTQEVVEETQQEEVATTGNN